MTQPQSAEVTGLLKAWSDGDPAALDRLAAKVYRELHGMARRYMRNERPGNTLQTGPRQRGLFTAGGREEH